nr:uncharacterized protein LOC112274498 isoform X7 [Physcomitrium patens]|eukprot:XP_024359833.1 uncharacterized protein LOC112274498 isoform X7 [Physcomitrella patens]
MFLQSLLVLFQDWAFWQMMYPGCMQSEYGDVMCNGSNGGTVFKFKEEAAFLAGKDGMEGQCAASGEYICTSARHQSSEQKCTHFCKVSIYCRFTGHWCSVESLESEISFRVFHKSMMW